MAPSPEPPAEHALRDQTRAALKAAGIRQVSAAATLGLSQKHLSQMLTGKVPLTLGWAEQLLALCGLRPVITVKRLPRQRNPRREP